MKGHAQIGKIRYVYYYMRSWCGDHPASIFQSGDSTIFHAAIDKILHISIPGHDEKDENKTGLRTKSKRKVDYKSH